MLGRIGCTISYIRAVNHTGNVSVNIDESPKAFSYTLHTQLGQTTERFPQSKPYASLHNAPTGKIGTGSVQISESTDTGNVSLHVGSTNG